MNTVSQYIVDSRILRQFAYSSEILRSVFLFTESTRDFDQFTNRHVMKCQALFCSRCVTQEVPRIGTLASECCKSYANASWITVASSRFATASRTPLGAAESSEPSGAHRTKATPFCAQYSSTPSWSRFARLHRFCTVATVKRFQPPEYRRP